MSIKILVKIELTEKNIILDEIIDLSFFITGLGIKYRIGTNFGGNIAPVFSKISQGLKKNEMIFEITDDPMDINAENLFSGDCDISQGEEHIKLVYESLFSRMSRVQEFLENLLNNKKIKKLIVNVNALDTFDYQKFDKIEITVSEFTSKMVELFAQHNQMTPTVRIYFIK
ncbi:hypothetical protein KJ644_01695 [Candidatus Dependentiae bacterium]|nr:hypothetical protein [Candidatus Dependentiae bacterium]MBU4387165.1 hypothetical protein [Candidatus Dependentiae bacterium]MCG2756750.1 hypothetical protein [Candidatus Dependentiae bacterium]